MHGDRICKKCQKGFVNIKVNERKKQGTKRRDRQESDRPRRINCRNVPTYESRTPRSEGGEGTPAHVPEGDPNPRPER